MHRMTPAEFEHSTVKSTMHTLNSHLEAQILVRFALRLAVSEIQGCQKLVMHRMTPNWTHNSQKYPVYSKHLPLWQNFGPFHSATSGFEYIAHFIKFYIDYHVKRLRKEHKKMPNIQNFPNSLNNFGRDPPQDYVWYLRVNPICVLSEEMPFEMFTPDSSFAV